MDRDFNTIRSHILILALILTGFFVFTLTHTHISTTKAAITDGLVGYWNFDEGTGTTAGDSSGNNHTGTLTGTTLPTWVTGKIGAWALSFDGTGQRVNTGGDWIGTSAGTYSAWINPTVTTSGVIIINNRTRIQLVSSGRISFISDGGTNVFTANNVTVAGTWIQVVVTRDASGIANIYINGVLSGPANQNSGIPAAGTTNVYIGASSGGTSGFNGILDDLRIYNRVLTTQEITDLYNFTGGTPTPTPAPTPPSDTTPPVLSAGSPTGILTAGTTSTTLSVTTDENATCKYGTVANTAYASIISTFTTTGTTSHSSTITGLTNSTSYTYYVRCQDVAGNSDTADYSISFSVASVAVSGTPLLVDVYIDMEAGNNGDILNPALLASATHGSSGTWTTTPSTGFAGLAVSNLAEYLLPSQVQVRGGARYNDVGTRGWAYNQTISNQKITYKFSAERSVVTLGGFAKFNSVSTGGANEYWDHLTLSGSSGQGAVMQQHDYTGNNNVWVHVSNRFGSHAGNPIPITPGKTYWYTMKWDRTALLVTLYLYDPISWALVGSSSDVIIDDSITSGTVRYLNIGEIHSLNQASYQYFDDLVIDWTTAVFPLLPVLP